MPTQTPSLGESHRQYNPGWKLAFDFLGSSVILTGRDDKGSNPPPHFYGEGLGEGIVWQQGLGLFLTQNPPLAPIPFNES